MIDAKSLVIAFLVSVLFHVKECDNSKKDFIIWKTSTKLALKDFQGTKPDSSNASAGASVKLKVTYVIREPATSFDVRCVFFKKESWFVYSYTGQRILLHEQGHFDIGEIFARKLRQNLAEAVARTPIISPRRLDSITKIHAKALNGMQVLYDNDTNHSLIIDEQERWNLQIRKMLDSLNAYSQIMFTFSSRAPQRD